MDLNQNMFTSLETIQPEIIIPSNTPEIFKQEVKVCKTIELSYLQQPKTSQECAAEFIACQKSPFYFIYKYIYLEETGSNNFKLTPDNLHPKMKRVVKSITTYHRCVLMASRQLGKSTIAACLLSWALIFYPKIKAVILNMQKTAAYKNLQMVKDIISKCPKWMVTSNPFKSRGGIKGYLDLWNGSYISAVYPSTVHSPTTLARSLTIPIYNMGI